MTEHQEDAAAVSARRRAVRGSARLLELLRLHHAARQSEDDWQDWPPTEAA